MSKIGQGSIFIFIRVIRVPSMDCASYALDSKKMSLSSLLKNKKFFLRF